MEAGVSSVEDLKLAIEKSTATIQSLQSKVGCGEGVDLLKSVCFSFDVIHCVILEFRDSF